MDIQQVRKPITTYRNKELISEIEKLIDLASEVSDHIKNIDDQLFKIRVNQLISIFFMYISAGGFAYMTLSYSMRHIQYALRIGILIALFLIMFISLSNFITRRMERLRIKEEIETETRVLNKLIDMISSLKENINKEKVGVVQYAIIEMKINRIKFSPRNRELESIT